MGRVQVRLRQGVTLQAMAACLFLLLAGCTTPHEPNVQFTNLADDFVSFWDRTGDLPTEQRTERFKAEISTLFPDFYGVERYLSPEYGDPTREEAERFVTKRIENEISGFPGIRDRYIEKMQAFDGLLNANVKSFQSEFADFRLTTEIILLHSLGEMDGGTREFGEKRYLIFGADGMARFHTFESESAFFHHELFHIYHEPRFGNCEEIWCAAWGEGLAVYIAQHLNPDASLDELLLDIPGGLVDKVDGALVEALVHFRAVSKSTEFDVYKALFQMSGDETGLPPRRGYYLGFLVVRELGKTYNPYDLANFDSEEVEPLFFEALNRLEASVRDGHPPPFINSPTSAN